jgi:hypothetical protein
MRKHLLHDFERIDHIDLHGNVRNNPKLSGTTHNVFGVQVGVGITLAIKKSGANRRLRYHRVPEMVRKTEKLEFLTKGEIPWETLTPDAQSWIVPENADEFSGSLPIDEMFGIVETPREENGPFRFIDVRQSTPVERHATTVPQTPRNSHLISGAVPDADTT